MRALAFASLLLLACSSGDPKKMEDCHNGVDDDHNGVIDCADPACMSDMGCVMGGDAGYFGTCPKCGQTCNNQAACLNQSWSFDTPLPICAAADCRNYTTGVQVDVQIDTAANWTGFTYPIRSTNIRFVSKTAVDGSAVSCATVQAKAMGKTQADADQIEKANVFNVVGYDSRKVTASGGDAIPEHFVNVNVGSDFVLWVELWGGSTDSVTHLPTGNRFGWGCYESGAPVAAISAADDCSPSADAGICRLIEISMPAPQ
ncbi:MAG: hypothetical protein QM723_35310 [Myxococcaceae bacterium]